MLVVISFPLLGLGCNTECELGRGKFSISICEWICPERSLSTFSLASPLGLCQARPQAQGVVPISQSWGRMRIPKGKDEAPNFRSVSTQWGQITPTDLGWGWDSGTARQLEPSASAIHCGPLRSDSSQIAPGFPGLPTPLPHPCWPESRPLLIQRSSPVLGSWVVRMTLFLCFVLFCY